MPDLTAEISNEIYAAMQKLGAPPELLCVIGSWRDTLPDDQILVMLKDWNAHGIAIKTEH